MSATPRKLPQSYILITGAPGSGKTTLFKSLLAKLDHFHPVGFYTEEIRKGGIRKGFALTGLDGRDSILAHIDLKSNYRVGKYGVDVAGFERFIEPIPFLDPSTELIGIDEIGKMECFSAKFKDCLKDIFNSDKMVVATIAQRGSGPIAHLKRRPDIRLFELTRDNRERLFSQIVRIFQ